MAKRSELLYWTGSAWANARFRHYSSGAWADHAATAGTDINPVKSATISEMIGNPRKSIVTIVNHPLDGASTTDHEGRGRFTGAFSDFQNLRLRDGETGTILVSGKIYDLEEKYDHGIGNVIILTIQDNLEELRNFTTGAWVDIPLAYTTGSRISSDIVTLLDNVKYLDTDSINFEGTGKKYEASATVYDQAGSIEFPGNNTKLLKIVSNLSSLDPHADGVTDTYGYDYYVDPAVITNATDAEAIPDWNYFKRGTRPVSAPQTHGLTVKYPSASFTEDGYTRRMHTDFEFNEPKGELYSDVVLTYHDKGVRTQGGQNADLTEGGEAEITKTRKFERIDVSSISGTFTGLGYPFGQSEILTFTPTGGGATNFARFEYQSATSSTGFIVVSPLDENGFTANFPEVAGTITGTSSSTTAVTSATCRPAKNFGIRKTKTVTHTAIADVQKLRQEVTSYLGRSTTVIKRGNYRTSNYPYHYIDAAAANVARSGGTITFSSTPFATNGGSATNNPELFGVKVGDVIAELDSTATSITRYAYISATTSSTVVYGGNTAAETSDDTALDASKPMRIFIPLRAGHVIQTTNALANVSGTHLVTELHFNEDNGLSFTRISSVGKNDSASKLGHTGFESIIQGSEKYGEDNVNKFTNIANVKSWTFTGTVSATDSDTIEWTAGKLYDDSGGQLFSIGSGNTGNMSAESIVYFDPTVSQTVFSTSTRAAYDDKVNRVKILAANNTLVAGGSQATFSYLTPVSGFSTTGTQLVIGADAIANASMTSTLSKKGMQGWATDIIFEGVDWNSIKWHKVDSSDTTSGNVSFSDDVAEGISYSAAGAKVFSGDDLDATVYCYKTVGDSPSTTLVFTRDYTDLYKDSRILMATFVVAASDDDTDSPSIFPFNGSQPTISVGLLSAGAIVADNIQADEITTTHLAATALDAHTITLASGGKFVTASGLGRDSTNQWTTMAGGGTGGGLLIDATGIIGTSKSDDGDINDTEFYIAASDGKFYAGGGAVKLDSSGVTITGEVTSLMGTGSNMLTFVSGGNDEGYTGIYESSSPGVADSYVMWAGQSGTTIQLRTANANIMMTAATSGNVELTGQTGLLSSGVVSTDKSLQLSSATASGSVPTSSYGTFKYALDGNGDDNPTLGFLSGQDSNTPAAATAESAFWSMLSESDGSGGSRLIFEPIVDYSGANNRAYIGWHNPLFATYSYYLNAGAGSAASPSLTMGNDINSGFYNIASGHTGYSDDTTLRVNFGYNTNHTTQSSSDGSAVASGCEFGVAGTVIINSYLYVSSIFPKTHGVGDLGTSSRVWDDIYTAAGDISSSDVRLKENIKPTVLGLDFINDLNPVSYKWIDKREGTDKPDQTHYGIIAQEVIETLKKHGIDSIMDFGGIHGKEETYYGARYQEFIPILMKAVQELSVEIKELKEKN